jgi:MOSC domain-containing protein YiiM
MKGLTGDRYARKRGTFSATEPKHSGRALTLIESEALEAFKARYELDLSPAEARRNLVTVGIRLNDLVGKKFYVGTVLVAGVRLCDPCSHLQKLTQKPVLAGLDQWGGLRADILSTGVIQVGDTITLIESKPE